MRAPLQIEVRAESWPIAGRFAIARGAKTTAEVVVVELREGEARGRGECVPYARCGESVESVMREIEALAPALQGGLDRGELMRHARGAARSAIDLALWELESSRCKRSVAELAGLAPAGALPSAITISIDAPEAMASRARALGDRPVIKVKLAGDGLDLDRIAAIREAAPAPRLWADVNEGWDIASYDRLAPRMAELGVALLEQPLPAISDSMLAGRARPVPLCADESFHDRASLSELSARYDVVNVKLDKAGGLTGALAVIAEARAHGLEIAIGCMVSTSLAIAPASLLAPAAGWIDLDGSILLARDREGGARLDERGWLVPPTCWGVIER